MHEYLYTHIVKSLESREREREVRRFHQTNIHHTCTELHVYKHIFTAYSTQEQIQATAHQFFFWNDPSTLPQMIS